MKAGKGAGRAHACTKSRVVSPPRLLLGWVLCQGQRGAERSVPLTPASGISQLSMPLRSKTTTNLLLSLYDTRSQL